MRNYRCVKAFRVHLFKSFFLNEIITDNQYKDLSYKNRVNFEPVESKPFVKVVPLHSQAVNNKRNTSQDY
jgi:hypothetical protein